MSTPLPNARKCTQSCSLPQSHLSSTVHQHSSRVVPCEDLDLILGTSSMPSTAPWTPALEPVLLATHALHALLSAALLRPATPPTPLAPSLCIDESPALAAHLRPTAILDARAGFWTPALEPALLATCALHSLFLVTLLRPVTPPTPLARNKGRLFGAPQPQMLLPRT